MAKKDEEIFDEEVQRIAHKTNYKITRTDYAFDKQIEKLDTEIDLVLDKKYKELRDIESETAEFKNIKFEHDTVDHYRRKLRKI